jgi:hypothetical protein
LSPDFPDLCATDKGREEWFVTRFSRFVCNRQREGGVVFLHLLLPEVCKISIVERMRWRKRENNILDNLQRLAIVVKNYIEG